MQQACKKQFLIEYAQYPVMEIKKLYLCKAAYEKSILQFETLKAENEFLKAELKRLNAILGKNLTLVT